MDWQLVEIQLKNKNIKFKNITVFSAISRTSIMFCKVSERGLNNDLYMDFLSNLMNILNEKQLKNVVFIMDNAAFHKGESIKSLITAWGLEVFYLPPSSPFLNSKEKFSPNGKGL
ncbi:hypothetical protein RF11_04249 [Thelohanellus kitauei]|uniref:Tc1-like transposase DDE domain-containing protein n=1 Tax=Thelohanellus kitauei TaxID=669202 RepID=A0A0C2IY27_THEKT|nr:hypothetical protein RF11_04249 [Thelohanellus kitauei]